ncbi:MAG TPA: hypothetical protein VMQ65_09555 [Candidatus Limnocylindria bacterium]|nr:hypothetical protein [Candidatus Limnocylindria bacterium]
MAVAVTVGLAALGTFDTTPDPNGIPAGSKAFMLALVIAVVVGFAAYAAVEWIQTRRLDSIARQFDTRTIVLIPIAIAINIVLGQAVGTALKLPVYLDSIGTILVGVLAGPIAGAATGLLSNLAWTFLLAGTPFGSPYAWPFAIVAIEIGLLAGLFGYAGVFRSRPSTPWPRLATGIVVGLVVIGALVWYGVVPFYRDLCALRSTPLRLCFQFFVDGPVPVDPLFIAIGVGIAVVLVVAAVAVAVRLLRDRDLGLVFVLVAGVACGVVSAFVAAPIAALVFGGITGSGTDLLVFAFQYAGSDLQLAVLQQSLISDSIDKTASYLVVFAILGALSRRVAGRFPQGERALGTIEA